MPPPAALTSWINQTYSFKTLFKPQVDGWIQLILIIVIRVTIKLKA